MATISLRAYYREIESLIEGGRTRDAVAHCRQILKFHPKSVDTYRLLGKAYLESQRFGEAADVLQRVLSAVPDDFISQIGMSIIREDEGNLDAALWHMERAFEAQPSNLAVQDELRRLYGRRDGMQPAKIRLTRGALVRMYARGDLYQQAIAEARMALVEQPDRVDIELILAKMFYLSNQKVSATEVCTRLLEKLPFCLEANKMLIDLLPGTARADEINTYQKRIIELDPYLAYIPQGSSSSADAPDESVMVESLELADEGVEHPEWGGGEEEQLPEWLAALETRERPPDELSDLFERGPQASIPSQATLQEAADVVANEDDQIPQWMKAAGWEPAEREGEAPPANFDEVAEELTSEAEIPEWLQSIAPVEETSDLFETEDAAESEEDNQWLESILAGTPEDTGSLDEFEEEPSEELSSFGAIDESEFEVPAANELHELQSLAAEEPVVEPELQPEDLESASEFLGPTEPDDTVPDWLAGLASIETEPEEEEAVEEFSSDADWLKTLALEEEKPAGEELTDELAEPVMDEPLAAAEIEPVSPDFDAAIVSAPFDETQPDKGLSSEEFLSEIESAISPEQDATQPTRISQPPFEGESVSLEPAFAESDEILPDLTDSTEQEEGSIEEMAAEEVDLAAAGLEEFLPDHGEEERLASIGDLEIPDWLKETLDKDLSEVESGIVEEEPGTLEGILEEGELLAETGSDQRVDEDLSWLKKLAEAPEEEEEISAAAAAETLKEPLEESATEEIEELPVDLAEEDVTTGQDISLEEQPEWSEPAQIEPAAPETAPLPEEQDIILPDWLKEDLAEPEEEVEGIAAEAVEVSDLEGEFEWVNEEERPLAGEPTIADEAETTFEATEELQETAEKEADLKIEFTEPEVEQEELEEAALIEGMDFDLPEEMAEKVEAAAEEPSTPEAVEEEIEEVPDWLMALAEDTESEPEPAAVVEEAIPEWLKEIEEEESEGATQWPAVGETVEPAAEETLEGQTWAARAEEIPTVSEIEDTSPIKVTPPAREVVVPTEGTTLYNAQAAMIAHDVETALAHYNHLIAQGESLEEIIHDLREALDHYPVDIAIWQSLGDAYMRSNQLQEALDAYTKAEELLH